MKTSQKTKQKSSPEKPEPRPKKSGAKSLLTARNFKWASWAFLGIIIVVSLTVGIVDNDSPQSPGERAASIARTIRCPQCDGETVAESNAPIAIEIRADINRRVSAGETTQDIRNVMANLYGNDILLVPPGEGFGSSVWIIPIVGLSLALGILGIAFWRWRFVNSYYNINSDDDDIAGSDAADPKTQDNG